MKDRRTGRHNALENGTNDESMHDDSMHDRLNEWDINK